MSNYKILLSKKVQKQLDKLFNEIVEPILLAISQLEYNPRPIGCKKLKGVKAYRIRIGNYRVIYDILDKELIIDVITLGHRKDIYQ